MTNLVKVVKLIINYQNLIPGVDVNERPELSGTAKGLWVEPGLSRSKFEIKVAKKE